MFRNIRPGQTYEHYKAASGYQVQYSTSKKFVKNKELKRITSGKTTAKTMTKLKKKTTYYVRIRSYKIEVGVFSDEIAHR